MTQEESKGGTESEGDRRAAVREGCGKARCSRGSIPTEEEQRGLLAGGVPEAVNGGSKDWPEKGQDEQHAHCPQEGLRPCLAPQQGSVVTSHPHTRTVHRK